MATSLAFNWETITPSEVSQFFTNAPAWANYFAADFSGNGWFYENMPTLNYELDRWECTRLGDCCIPAGSGYPTTNWEKSLLKRP